MSDCIGARARFAVLGFVLAACSVGPVHAYKIDAHVYIAQQVLNDAADGKIDVPILNEKREVVATHSIPVNPRYLRAIRTYPEYYRMGSIGPDAFPSVEVGQLLIHPGHPKGWGTADWLNHLLQSPKMSDQELAFVLGNLAHAAADVFAHTYVNRYVGEIFEIKKNEPAARRHVMMESFISRFLPPIQVHGSPRLYRAHELVRDRNGNLAIPHQFIFDKLFFHPDAQGQTAKSSTTEHIKLIGDLRKALDEFTAKGGVVDKLEVAAIQIALKITLGLDVNKGEARKIREYSEKIHSMGDFTDEGLKVVNDVQQAFGKLVSFEHGEIGKVFAATDKAVQDVLSARKRLADLRNDALNKKDEIEQKIRTRVIDRFTEDTCRRRGCRWSPSCRATCGLVERTKDITDQVVNGLHGARNKVLKEIDDLEQSAGKRLKSVHDALKEAMKTVEALIDTKIRLNQEAMGFFKGQNSAHSPIRRFIGVWRRDIDQAMIQYIQANGETLVKTITPGADDVLRPYKDWFSCHSKAIIGVPAVISRSKCVLKEGEKTIKQHIDEFQSQISKVSPATEAVYKLKKELEEEIAKLKTRIIDAGTTEIAKRLSALVEIDLLMWKRLLTESIADGALNVFFSQDPSRKGLLLIGDIEQRMRAEMAVQPNQQLDPQRFDALRNSIMLAKLALLDQDGLRQLATKEGLGSTFFGPYLYDGEPRYAHNILFGFARSIDGNDQWHVQSPPHPRVTGYDKDAFLHQRRDPATRYGYANASCDGTAGERAKGMRMWVDGSARLKLFKRIFTAPVVPGIEVPSLLGTSFKQVLHASYPRKLSAADPWGEDGIEIDPDNKGQAAFARGRIRGTGATGFAVKVMIVGRVPLEPKVEPTGAWQVEASIQNWRLDECFVVEILTAKGKPVKTYLQSFRKAFAEN